MATNSPASLPEIKVMQTGQPDESPVEGRLETNIKIKIGEVKGLPTTNSAKPHDTYVSILLDREELYRSTIIEKAINPIIGEELSFLVPRHFNRLTFYVCDGDAAMSKDPRVAHCTFTREELSRSHEFSSEKWYSLYPVTHDSEVQGSVLIGISTGEITENSIKVPVVSVKVCEAMDIAAWNTSGHYSNTYCTVALMDLKGELKSDIRKGAMHRRTISPTFNETYRFKLNKLEDLKETIVRVSLWHQQLLGEDVFLGQVFLALSSLDPTPQSRSYDPAWYSLCPRSDLSGANKLGSARLLLLYQEDFILPLATYQPFMNLLVQSMSQSQNFNDTALCIFHEVCKDRAALGRSIVKLFLQIGKFQELVARLIEVEVESTSDPNTLFRGNSVASKVIDEFMKESGQSYLHRTLQSSIDEIFELKRSCEIDQTRLAEGENLDVNMTNLLYFVEKFMSAITSSARSCPHPMVQVFALLRKSASKKFSELHGDVGYTAISAFVFLRFFAPAILNPKLFALRPENPTPVVARSLLLISKTIQNMGNISSRQRRSSLRKEDYMVPLLAQLMDDLHIKAVTEYLDAISDGDNLITASMHQCKAYREGYLVKRSLARKKITMKNFKRRFFVLSSNGLSYSKTRGEASINTIPTEDMLAVERLHETAFNMKFMLQLVQPERILYLQAQNSVEQTEWLSALSKVCSGNESPIKAVHNGAFLSHAWTCCGSEKVDQPGCKPISLAVKLLAGNVEDNVERELNKLYRLLLDSQEKLLSLKDEVSRVTRSSYSGEDANKSDLTELLPSRLSTICELIVFIKNLELSSKCKLLKRPQKLGSRDSPFTCDYSEAYVVK